MACCVGGRGALGCAEVEHITSGVPSVLRACCRTEQKPPAVRVDVFVCV